MKIWNGMNSHLPQKFREESKETLSAGHEDRILCSSSTCQSSTLGYYINYVFIFEEISRLRPSV